MNAQYSESFADIRADLEERRRQHAHRLSKVRANLRQKNGPLDPDWSEQALQLENDEVLALIEDASMEDLAAIEHALQRMDSGEYGDCAHCERPIDPRRLKALPFVTSCIDCARQAEGDAPRV